MTAALLASSALTHGGFDRAPKGGKGFLLGQSASDQQPNYTGIQVQTAVWTLPTPVGYGVFKGAPNVIDAVNFQSHDASTGKGGKGGAKDYSASVELALCEGVVDSVPLVFVNGTTLKTISALGMSLFPGTWPDQAPWSYLADNGYYGDAPYGYPGIAYLVRANYDLGAAASVPNHNVLIQRTTGFQATWCNPSTINGTAYPPLLTAFPAGIPTADLALVIQDILTNQQYGILNFPSSAINTATLLSGSNATTTGDAAAQTYWRALGLGFTIKLDSVETFQSTLGRWLQLGNCAAVWSGKALKSIPYGDSTITANGVTYLPNLTPVYALDDEAYVGDASDDPVKVDRTDPSDAANVVRLEVTMDDGWFSYIPVEYRDQNAIEESGANRIMPTVTGHEILGQTNGLLVAQLLLKQSQLWRNTVKIRLSAEFCLLEPMDFVTLTDPALGYVTQKCRVLEVEEDGNGDLTVTLQKYIPGSSSVSANYSGQTTGHAIPDQGQTASSVSPPVVVEPSSLLSGANNPQFWIAACGGNGVFDPNWGGAQVWLSTDNATYKHLGDITERARIGALTSSLAAYGGSNPDTVNTLHVDLSESGGTLETVSAGDAANGATLCYVDGELLSFETATLVSQTSSNEGHTIPSVAPYQIPVTHAGTWASDGGVIYTIGGTPLTFTSGTPGPGQYGVTAGLYVFNVADAGKGVEITYTWNNPYHYALTTLYRGLYGTSAGAHSSATKFARLDDAVFKSALPVWAIGQTIYLKLVSFTAFGGNYPGLQDISTITATTYTPAGTGYGGGSGGVPTTPSGLTGSARGPAGDGFNVLGWNANPAGDNVQYYTILRQHGGGGYSAIGTSSSTNYTDYGTVTGFAYDYEVTAHNSAGDSSASGSVTVTTN